MQIKVTGRGTDITPAIRDYALDKASKLEEFFSNIQKVEVVIEAHAIDDVEKRQVAEIRAWMAGKKMIRIFSVLMVLAVLAGTHTLQALGILPFAIMHAGGKPIAEAFGSILAAYFLGLLVLKVRSFWVCPLIHFMVAFSMDLIAAFHRGLF